MTLAPANYKLVLPLVGGGVREFVLGDTIAILGRGSTSDIVVDDQKVSRSHARIECTASCCTVEDLSSANGTLVNGQLIDRTVVKPGDAITIGSTTLKIESVSCEQDYDATMLDQTGAEADVAENSIAIRLHDNDAARLVVRIADEITEHAIKGDAINIGRAPDNDVVLPFPNVSRHHARVERRGNCYIVRDLHSENGIWMGRCRIAKSELRHGDGFRIGFAQLAFKQDFSPQQLLEPLPGAERHTRMPLVIVPGFGGSKLWLGTEQVWPGVGSLLRNFEVLKYCGEPLRADGLVDQVVIIPNLLKLEQYSRLSEYMEEGLGYERNRNLLEFAYDFRQDIRLNARGLAELIENWHVPRPITILAHSMGCLVSRYYVERLGGDKHIGRMILMGGPHNGAPKAFAALFMGPKYFPFGLLDSELRELIATFPSSYQILPAYACVMSEGGDDIDIFDHSHWLPTKQRMLLQFGRDFRRELGRNSRVPSVCIFGYGLKTITSIIMSSKSGAGNAVRPIVEPKGDSTVPESSAILPDTEIHPVRQYHGSLFVDSDVKMRMKVELTRKTN